MYESIQRSKNHNIEPGQMWIVWGLHRSPSAGNAGLSLCRLRTPPHEFFLRQNPRPGIEDLHGIDLSLQLPHEVFRGYLDEFLDQSCKIPADP
jgi:hypothetical protein